MEQTNFEFYPLKIIFKIVDLKSLYIKNLKLNISRDKEGFFNFINIPLKSTNLKLKYDNINVNLFNYDISFNDKFYNNKICFKGNKLLVNNYKSKFLKVEIDGNLNINNKNTIFDFELASKLPLNQYFDDVD